MKLKEYLHLRRKQKNEAQYWALIAVLVSMAITAALLYNESAGLQHRISSLYINVSAGVAEAVSGVQHGGNGGGNWLEADQSERITGAWLFDNNINTTGNLTSSNGCQLRFNTFNRMEVYCAV